ncbi:glycosyltransferase family 2 protein [Tenacibaculum sp. UWU-22]|uniref:glycosyltransferase family 2 protein n=1 Tax=Tenacibaculum sp. UWU-22 TaxID=3234187 RepID=UPI0034DAE8DA
MLSVLIATYNWDVIHLVENLHQQLNTAAIPFEIICIDDASNSNLNTSNQEINKLTNCYFKTLPKNVGRSALRNLLASKAKHEWLLFLDADVLPTTPHFIKNYLTYFQKNKSSVYVGGVMYRELDDKNLIRWKLGKKNEEQPIKVRNKKPYKYLFTSNFAIKKTVFNPIKFNETLTQYGYEDLLFAKKLEQQKTTIQHINNTVYHIGIDNNTVFLNKTKQALKNLVFLVKSNQISKKDTGIFKTYCVLNRLGLPFFLAKINSSLEKLTITKSSFFYYQLFKLGYLNRILKNTH